MKSSYNWLFPCLLAGLLLVACKKNTDVPADASTGTSTEPPTIGGTTSAFKDTTDITEGNVNIKFAKTDACFPSNEIFSFTAVATGVPANAKYVWEFGDGKSLMGASVKNIYKDPGNYTVILEVKSNEGQVLHKVSIAVKALGQQVTPTAVFSSALADINILNNMTFTSRSSVPTGTITEHYWDWADGTSNTSSNSFMPKNFPQVPEDKLYPVKLIVTANSGCKDTAGLNVFVPAVYNISGSFDAVQYDGCTNEYFIFTPRLNEAPDGCVYTWDFADATGFVSGNPVKKSFTYQNDYDVKLTVTLKGKIIYQTHKSVRAFGQNIKPKALMLKNVVSSTPTTEKWAFYSQSNIPHGYLSGYRWEMPFGVIDDNFNTIVEQEYTRAATPTNYSIKLIVTGNTGCKDTAVANITIPAR